MDVYEILEKNSRDLYPEDLDFFETELATGDYDQDYKIMCLDMIEDIRHLLEDDGSEYTKTTKSKKNNPPKKLLLGIEEVVPDSANSPQSGMSAEDVILKTLQSMRNKQGYKTALKNYIKDNQIFNAEFIEKHFSFFTDLELDAIAMTIDFPEPFLEKYFGAFSGDKIARYQKFSEQFFMKHFADLDYNVVLTVGKNDWRHKDKRSRQLDVFLRLKGINI